MIGVDKGLFITFEGGEGAGKSTLIDRVFVHLAMKGYLTIKTREPGGTKTGELIRELLLHKKEVSLQARAELLLFLADRAQHVDEVILPALKRGEIVLCDRFNDSTLAYQGGARGFDLSIIENLCRFASAELPPQMTFYLDIDPRLGLERVKKSGVESDRIEAESLAFHDRIRTAYRAIVAREPHRVHLIDASASSDEVFQKTIEKIDAAL